MHPNPSFEGCKLKIYFIPLRFIMRTNSSDTIHVLIVEDSEPSATGLKVLLKDFPDVEVVAIVANGIKAREFLMETTNKVDIVLMDIVMQSDSESGIKYTKQLKWRYPDLRFIAYSAFGDENLVKKFFDVGGLGFLDKIDEIDEIVHAITCVQNGGRYLSESVQKYSGSSLRQLEEKPKNQLLTSKQLEVLELRAKGLTNKAIAQYLHLSEETIKSHTKNIITKLEASNMSNAIYIASKLGLI